MPHFPGWFVAICILLPIANAIGSHGDRYGGSKCVPTGLICVPCKKSLKVQEKSFQAFFVFIRMQ